MNRESTLQDRLGSTRAEEVIQTPTPSSPIDPKMIKGEPPDSPEIVKLVYCGIIRIRGGSIFVEFVVTPHPRIYILNETIRTFLLNTNEKKEWYAKVRINQAS